MTDHSANILSLYHRNAQTWAQKRGDTVREDCWLKPFLDLIPQSKSVLDIGCGSGLPIGRYFIENGCDVTAVDGALDMVKIAQVNLPEAQVLHADMRDLDLNRQFGGILAWNSSFHLTPEDQRGLFPIFRQHAALNAPLMFTSGTGHGTAMGTFEGETLYHGSLAPDEYRDLLAQNGFELLRHKVEDPDCGRLTVWLAQYRGLSSLT